MCGVSSGACRFPLSSSGTLSWGGGAFLPLPFWVALPPSSSCFLSSWSQGGANPTPCRKEKEGQPKTKKESPNPTPRSKGALRPSRKGPPRPIDPNYPGWCCFSSLLLFGSRCRCHLPFIPSYGRGGAITEKEGQTLIPRRKCEPPTQVERRRKGNDLSKEKKKN